MDEIINPYIAGAPVTEKNMFFGREDVFQWIEHSLSGQYADHILVIHGQRRVGKTSVLKQLGNRLPKRYIPVFFDLQGRTHTTLDRFLWWLAREIVRVLKQDRDIELPVPEKEAFATDIEYFEHRFLSDLGPVLADHSLLLTFDEFDNLEESEVKEELARPLTDYLRRLMGNPRLNFIFSIGSSGRKLENMQAAYTEFFKTALYKKISFLNEEQTRKLITLPVANIIEYEQNAVTRIFRIAGGHPYFTQLTCHELFAKCQQSDERRIREADVEGVLDDVVERGTVNLKFVWDEAADMEKWALAALAQLEKTDTRALADYLRKQRVRFSETDLTSGLLHLREKDVITQENRFVIHLLRLWLQRNRPIEQAREELTEVNPIANRYIEIGLEFRDAGLFEKAIASFQEALEVSKENIQAQINIALTYMDQRAYGSAVAEFEKALTMDDEDVSARAGLCEAHLALGDAALEQGRTKDAILSYRRVLGMNQEHTEARGRMADIECQRAERALEEGRDEEALSAFAEALKYTPEEPALIARVEQVRAEKKAKVLAAQIARSEKEANARNWDQAIAALNEALQTAPQDESIRKRIADLKESRLQERLKNLLANADLAERASRWDAAIAALKEYLSLKPEAAVVQKRLDDLIAARHSAWMAAILARADRAVSLQKWDEAVAALNEVLSLEPDNAEIRKKMDETRQAQHAARLEIILRQSEQAAQAGKWDDAIRILKEAIASEPQNEGLQARLQQVTDAKRAARLKAALRLADTAMQAGKWNVAIDSLNEILGLEPGNAEVKEKLAQARARQREAQLSELRARARAFVRAARFDEALSTWQEYLALGPDDRAGAEEQIQSVKRAMALASSYAEAEKAYAKKNYDRTIALLKEIIRQDVNYKDATHLLAESIELRRSARKWWQSRWLWGGVAGLAVVIIGWLAFLYGPPLLAPLQATPASETSLPTSFTPPTQASPTALPTATAMPLPYTWARLNSGQFLPRDGITAIVVDPHDSGVIYVGTRNAGIYKSIDGGLSWQPIHNGLGRAAISRLVFDPVNSDTLYASTQGNLFRTTNAGASWQELTIDREFRDGNTFIVVDPQNSQLLYYATQDSVYRSLDGGTSWQIVKSTEECPRSIYAGFAGHITESGVLFASEWEGSNECQPGLYRSDDGGETWELIGLEGTKWIESIAVGLDLQGNDVLYATDTVEEPMALYISHDGGETWTSELNEGSPQSLLVDPDQPTIVYWGRNKSVDGGYTWNETITSPPDNITAITALSGGETLIAGTDAGLYISTDSGASWTERNSGLAGTLIDLKVDPTDPSIFYANLLGDFMGDFIGGSMLYRSTDSGRSWEPIERGQGLAIDSDGGIYRVDGTGLIYSQDGGKTWTSSLLPITDQDAIGLGTNPAAPGTVFVTFSGQHVYVTTDNGVTWQESTSTMSETELDYEEARFFFEPTQGQIGYMVPFFDAFRTSNAGITWEPCGRVEWSPSTRSIMTIDPRDSNRIILAVLGKGVFLSGNGCQSWQASNIGLGSLFVNSLALDFNNPDTIYAGTDSGAYVSLDGGQTWGQANNGLLGATVLYSIVVDSQGNVYAATPYGIFKLEGSD